MADFRQKGGAHIVILTVDSLEGEPIEQASIQVTDRWKLGKADEDNGILIFLAKADKKVRIEVGQGLEGDLPDAYAKQIIEDVMLPLFRRGDFAQGILLGVYQVARRTNPDLALFSDSDNKKWAKAHSSTFEENHYLERTHFYL